MQNFTHDELNALFNQSSNSFNTTGGLKTGSQPSTALLNRILGYNKAVSIRKSKHVSSFKVVMN